MKNRIYIALIVVLVVAFAGYNVYDSQKTVTMSELALANVEALARGETTKIPCHQKKDSSCTYSIEGSDGSTGTAKTDNAEKDN